MTSLSDFPPDVQAAAQRAYDRWMMKDAPSTLVAFAEVIMTDRAQRPQPRIGGLTAHQKRVMDYLTWFISKNGISPSFDDIRAHLGLASKSSVHRVITELEERGAIQRLPNRSRAITIISNPN